MAFVVGESIEAGDSVTIAAATVALAEGATAAATCRVHGSGEFNVFKNVIPFKKSPALATFAASSATLDANEEDTLAIEDDIELANPDSELSNDATPEVIEDKAAAGAAAIFCNSSDPEENGPRCCCITLFTDGGSPSKADAAAVFAADAVLPTPVVSVEKPLDTDGHVIELGANACSIAVPDLDESIAESN